MKVQPYRASVFALSTLIVASCAVERPAIDRVQPNGLDKAFFIGEDLNDPRDNPEFWSMATLIDVGYGAAQDALFTSTYAQPMSRVRWQVTEDYLFARLAYERIEGSDGKGAGAALIDGPVVAAFRIEKHYDVVNAYNPTTGEQLNIVEENAVDRPWYERQFMRVDWSRNESTHNYDFDTLSLVGIYGGVTYEPLSYYIEDPNDPDAPFFDETEGYFDVTMKAFAKPGEIDLSHLGWGIDSYPSCFLDNDFLGGSYPAGSCSPVELTLRHSFRRVVDNDYEPMDWDGYRFQSYGAFTVERLGYARNYGMSDTKWRRFIARYPIWERSHYYLDPVEMTGHIPCYTPETTPFGSDPNRDDDLDGTEDECALVGNGSRCDTFKQRCTLPFQERTPNPIAWYYTTNSNLDYYDATERATHEWDVAMRVAVRTAQYAECQRVGGSNCLGRFPVYFGQQDDNVDAIALAREVDDCRHGRAYLDLAQDPAACSDLADYLSLLRGYSEGVAAIAKMEEMVVLCHSPVEANDPEACGYPRLPQGVTSAECADAQEAEVLDVVTEAVLATCSEALSVRRGDLRYHQVNVMKEPQTPSPWGIYTDAEDPLTGETISASINVWSHVNDMWSQSVVDTMRYIAGELETSEITDGEYVRRWVDAARSSAGGTSQPGMTREEVDRRVDGFTRSHTDNHDADHAHHDSELPTPSASRAQPLPPEIYEKARALRKELKGVAAHIGAASTMGATYEARRQAAVGSSIEAELMTKMVQELNGVDGMPMSQGIMNHASPLRGGNPSLQRHLYQLRENALAERGACILHEAPAPMSITGLVDVMQEKFGAFNPSDPEPVQQARAERIRNYIATRAHYAVVVHEMGHSIGMRHNFVSSSDAMGYRPQYWQLRTKNGSVTAACTDLQADGTNCVGPRYYDPVTEEERDNLIWSFMHSSVMDYAGEITQDMLGLGAYDFAAAKMFYGDVVAVYADPSYAVGQPRASGLFSKMDNFGGILGITAEYDGEETHYTALQQNYDLIKDCATVDPQQFKPAAWDDNVDGLWHPTLDGLIVQVDGQHSRCKQQTVDYATWDSLRLPSSNESGGFYYGGRSVDGQGRIRVPYGFGTDGWADLGNVSVYRHDNGADIYEIFDFLITQQEVGHIFDNYRRNRQGFSVRSAVNRSLYRYNEKLRDGAKGLALFRNIYLEFGLSQGYNPDDYWFAIAPYFFPDNILASGMVFDHFAHLLARPQAGAHNRPNGEEVLRSEEDAYGSSPTVVNIPNGATGYYGDVGFGGRPIENQLASDKGEYDSQYTINAGSYYDKMYAAMLFTESVDNYISDSREDFVDARYRATSLADLFPDGYRRMLANALTDDEFIKGPRLSAQANGTPFTDGGFPAAPIGWTSWWGTQPTSCFPADGTRLCDVYGGALGFDSDTFDPTIPNNVAVIDSQIGWEQQKFLIAWTMLYLPENQQQRWIDMLRVWELGVDSDPGFANRIEFHHPSGKIYVAKTFGTEQIFGKTVQKGVAARVLEYANSLLVDAYETTAGPDLNNDGTPDWYLPSIDSETGTVPVLYDAALAAIDEESFIFEDGLPGCNATSNVNCTCGANRACLQLSDYAELPFFLRQALDAYGLAHPEPKGIY